MDSLEYETLVLVAHGRSTLDHIVQAFDIHSPQAHELLAALEEEGLIRTMSNWGAGALSYEATAAGTRALEGKALDGVRGVETLEQDESAILENITRSGRLPNAGDLHWNVSSTVQHLWEVGRIDVRGMIRPQFVIAAR